MQTFTNILSGCILAVAWPIVTEAAVVEYEATGIFTNSDFPSSVAVGDSFTCRLAYDDSVLDTDSRTNTARFNSALIAFQFSLSPGASGSYGGGSLISPSPIRADNAANLDSVYIFLNQGFGSIAGETVGVQFYLLDYSHSSSLNDLGSGQTLASVLGGTIHLNEFQDSRVVLSAGKSDATATITALSVVSLPRLGAFLMTNGQLCITWSTNASGYSLETSASLLLPSWDIDTNPPTILGDQFALIADTTAVQRFYRLHKQ